MPAAAFSKRSQPGSKPLFEDAPPLAPGRPPQDAPCILFPKQVEKTNRKKKGKKKKTPKNNRENETNLKKNGKKEKIK
jgi:hypothetical protein